MNRILLLIVLCFSINISYGQTFKQAFVATDIHNFWNAYEKIISTNDSIQQYRFLKELYLDKGTAGLRSLVEVRRYTEKEFINAIIRYPKFWASLKAASLRYTELYPGIEESIKKLQQAYPGLKPATIYFTVGAFRTNGTIHENRVLLGSELSLADESTVVDELPAWRQPFYKEYEPRKNIALLCTHEYIHTQQNELVENLLSSCLYEGVAEFISCKITGKKSNSPAIAFGKANQQTVVNKFVADLFIGSNNDNWLWGENTNSLKMRDLGYYIGYEICERYYNASANKTKAIKELIELDYTNETEVERIINLSKLLPETLEKLNQDYEKKRPTVTALMPFKNGSRDVKPGPTKITIVFSEPIVKYNTGIDYGPLGEKFFPAMNPVKTFSEDGFSWTFDADLKPNRHYQVLISNNFRIEDGTRLKPFLIDFSTIE